MTIAALGHSYSSEYTIDKAATCAAEGRKSRHCTRGGCTSVVDVTAIAKKEHKYSVWEEATPATCTDDGFMERVCTGCGDTQTGEIAARGHSFSSSYTVDKKATLSASGVKSKHCTRDDCTAKASKTTIAKISSVKLSKTSYTYDGNVKSPSVTVKDSNGKTLKKGTDYTVSYESGRKYPGRYTVKITFKGSYSGTKKIEFTIAPKATSKITATQTTTTITLKWNKVPGAYGYRVYKYNSKSKSYKLYKETKSTTMKVTGLSAGTTYKFKVMAYDVDNGKIYGQYSSVFETATKTKTPTLKSVTSSSKGKAVIKWNNVAGESGYQVYYSTSKNGTYKKAASADVNETSASKSKLTSKKTYYFKVRAYKKTASGTVYSAWSSVKSVKIK